MPETRYIEEYKDGVVINKIPYTVSDEQLADETETNALAKADQLIGAINNLAGAKLFLQRLVARLIKKGLLP